MSTKLEFHINLKVRLNKLT